MPCSPSTPPEGAPPAAKRKLLQKIGAAIASGYRGIADTSEIVVLMRQYPRDNHGINQVFTARPIRSSEA